jgi:DNA-directed RNA polymerase specialized sigma24 family protein
MCIVQDSEIIALFISRSQQAIKETARKYGKLCFQIAYNILGQHEDSQEVVNDTRLRIWNAIPPQRPTHLP